MPYFAKRATVKRPIPLGATVRFTRSAEAIPHDIVVSAKVWGPPITHGQDAARPSAGVSITHEAMYGQIWDYATPSAAWVVLPDRTADPRRGRPTARRRAVSAGERPTLLDLFGGRTGGAARRFQLAGWRVVSVDIEHCPDSPADVVIQSDALAPLTDLIAEYRPAAIHTSPPCPGEGTLSQGTMPSLATAHPRLIGPTRDALAATGLPYVIENVNGSSVRKDVTLCGEMFGLGVLMHRHFELGRWSAESPKHVPHRGYVRGWRHGVWRDGPYVAAYGKGGGKATVDEMREAKGIDWPRDHLGLRDALPPAYTEWIGARLLAHVRSAS